MPGLNNLNSILLEGALVRDPEVSFTPKGQVVTTFTLSSNRFFHEGEETKKETSFFDVKTLERLAEVCGEYLKKGREVRVVGRLKQEKWSDESGHSRSKVLILAEHVEFKPLVKTPAQETVDELIEEK